MDIDLATIGIFMAASFAVYIAPGPDIIFVASRSIGQGRRAGMISALGVSVGLLMHMLAAAFGLAAVLSVWPAAFLIVKWGGVAYLIYLGIRAIVDRDGTFQPENGTPAMPAKTLFLQGLSCNLLNPKIALFFLAFLPQFTDPSRGDLTLQMLFFGALFNLGGLPWIMSMAVLFGAIGNWLASRPALLRLQRWVTGSSMLGLALFVALDSKR